MSLGRRRARLEDADAWIFNRMAEVYDARPPYPDALVETLASEMAGDETLAYPQDSRGRIADLGAGIGHLAVPLAERGFTVFAVEPARAMLERIPDHPRIERVHATAESAVSLETKTLDGVIIADALHFLDAERTALEAKRLLRPRGRLAVVVVELADTPFMAALRAVIEGAAPRRPRAVDKLLAQVAGVANVRLEPERRFLDERDIDHDTLDRILGSISFIGPAMNQERSDAFRSKVRALGPPRWARSIRYWSGRTRR